MFCFRVSFCRSMREFGTAKPPGGLLRPVRAEVVNELEEMSKKVDIPSFEEGWPRRSNKRIATSANRRGRGGQPFRAGYDLPRCADGAKVALLLFDRRSAPSSKEGISTPLRPRDLNFIP